MENSNINHDPIEIKKCVLNKKKSDFLIFLKIAIFINPVPR